jgi:tRNA-2-methylthio-N6-dimethylallyladenosine synthase
MPDQLPQEEKKRRIHRVEALQRRISLDKNSRLVGQTVEVLIEGQARGKWYGRTRTNKLVHVSHDDDLTGRLVEVEVVQAGPWSLQGELLQVPLLA